VATNNRKNKNVGGRSAASMAKKTPQPGGKLAGKAAKADGPAKGPAKKPGKRPATKPEKGSGTAKSGKPAKATGAKAAGAKATGAKATGAKNAANGKARRRKTAEQASVPPPPPSSKRNFGLRGAAPWVARHAAKHAEELRKRNAEPPPPGSARATLRIPPQAEQIKTKVSQLHQLIGQIRNMRKRLDKTFFEIGEVLAQVQMDELHVAKGYSSFESFLDREIDLPRTLALKLIRISHTFQKDTAYDFGLERLTSALAALDGEISQPAPSHPSSRSFSSAPIPPKPPIRFDD
jgi:hypothetical protein